MRLAKVRHKYEARKIPYYWTGHYTPDWDVVDRRGGTFIVEGKGYFRSEDKRKLVAVKRCNPHLDIRIVFYSYNKRNVAWCVKHGFKYAIKTIPKEWLDGC